MANLLTSYLRWYVSKKNTTFYYLSLSQILSYKTLIENNNVYTYEKYLLSV